MIVPLVPSPPTLAVPRTSKLYAGDEVPIPKNVLDGL